MTIKTWVAILRAHEEDPQIWHRQMKNTSLNLSSKPGMGLGEGIKRQRSFTRKDAHPSVWCTGKAWELSSHWLSGLDASVFLGHLSFQVDCEFKDTLSVQSAMLLEASRRYFDTGKGWIFRSGRKLFGGAPSQWGPGGTQSDRQMAEM